MKVKILMTAFVLGLFAISNMYAQDSGTSKEKAKNMKEVSYTCPMHPEVKSATKGECPKCGMDLKAKKMNMGHGDMAKTYTCSMHPGVTSSTPGDCPKCGMKLTEKKMKMEMKHGDMAKTYTCSMHPDVTSTTPGDCPKCGMKLTEKKMKKGDGHHHKH